MVLVLLVRQDCVPPPAGMEAARRCWCSTTAFFLNRQPKRSLIVLALSLLEAENNQNRQSVGYYRALNIIYLWQLKWTSKANTRKHFPLK
jgi:hypothetical protein